MVQGLAFLSKKSWHTKNRAVQEQVWLAEERVRAEAVKTAELAAQIQQEREQEELMQLAGQSTTIIDRGIDWMYHGQEKQSEVAHEDAKRQAEDFLLGKKIPEMGVNHESTFGEQQKKLEDHGGIHAIVSKPKAKSFGLRLKDPPSQAPGVASIDPLTVAERNEAFRVRLEDPMFVVEMKKEERSKKIEERRRLVSGNSVDEKQSAELGCRDRIVRSSEFDRRQKKRKHKDQKHKDKKRSKESKSRRSHKRDSESDDEILTDRRDRFRSPSNSSYEEMTKIRSERRASPPRYTSRSPPNRHDINVDKRYDSTTYEHHHGRLQEADRPHDERSHDSSNVKAYAAVHGPVQETKTGYGLQRSGDEKHLDMSDLGPNQEWLQRKRYEREVDRLNKRQLTTTRRYQSSEERAMALRAMQHDACSHRPSLKSDFYRDGQDRDQDTSNHQSQGASFLRRMAEETHGVRGNGPNLQERLHERRQHHQRGDERFL